MRLWLIVQMKEHIISLLSLPACELCCVRVWSVWACTVPSPYWFYAMWNDASQCHVTWPVISLWTSVSGCPHNRQQTELLVSCQYNKQTQLRRRNNQHANCRTMFSDFFMRRSTPSKVVCQIRSAMATISCVAYPRCCFVAMNFVAIHTAKTAIHSGEPPLRSDLRR